MNFAQTAKLASTIKQTENGALAYNTANNALLDLFAQIGALRPRSEAEIATKYANAYAVDAELATKMLFYCGNIRGGLGERRTFRICLRWLAISHPNVVRDNLVNIPHFNRWDSLFVLVGTTVEKDMWQYITDQLNLDLDAVINEKKGGKRAGISLLAKWMPTETAHSAEARVLAKKAMRALSVTPRMYRKMLSTLRAHLKVVESLMSANKWDEVEYPAVPSYAMKNYRKAFGKHDQDRFGAYIASLNKGEAKINASTLYPYDLVHEYMNRWTPIADPIIEAQWKALPNYVEGENNILVMADVSGSMYGRPMETSIGLATYFAQHATSDFHNLYMTFTDKPDFISLDGVATLAGAVDKVQSTGVGYSTNLAAAFRKILSFAIEHNISNNEMPKALVVISDMEIDQYYPNKNGHRKLDFVEEMKNEFAINGYTMPQLVFWNVEARNDTFLSQNNEVIYVSGQSASTFRNLCSALGGKTAWDFMLEVLNDKIYDCVVI